MEKVLYNSLLYNHSAVFDLYDLYNYVYVQW